MDMAIGLGTTYPLDSDLSGGQRYPIFEQPGPVINNAINRKNTFLCTMKAFIISDFIGTILVKKVE